jgi:hypothetical protein
MIDGDHVSPFINYNPMLGNNSSNSYAVLDSNSEDMDADSLEPMVVSTTNLMVEEGFVESMDWDKSLFTAEAIPGENLWKDSSLHPNIVHLEQSLQVAISWYFLVFEINGLLFH